MTPKALNKLLQRHDLGDDLFEDENRMFDESFNAIPNKDSGLILSYANNKMGWYWKDFDRHYLNADCNRWHFMFLAHMQEWITRNRNYANPAIGRAYGLWEGQPHMWAWAVIGGDLKFINWGELVDPKNIRYSGKGSMAV